MSENEVKTFIITNQEEVNNLINFLDNNTENNNTKVIFEDNIETDVILNALEKIYDYENKTDNSVLLFLKSLSMDKKVEIIKNALLNEELKNPVMILNIINLIKITNTFSSEFFEDENIYVSKVSELVDLRLKLKKELQEFTKKLNIYFISLFKSYNKVTYSPLDNHKKMPRLFKIIMESTDILTLSGIFSVGESFNTSECMFIEDGIEILSFLLDKGGLSSYLMNSFLGENK